jgi:hypothetical protein
MKPIFLNDKILEWLTDYVYSIHTQYGYNISESELKAKLLFKTISVELNNLVDNYESTGYLYRSKHSDFHYAWPIYITKNKEWSFAYSFNGSGIYLYDVIWSANIKSKQESKQHKTIYIKESQLKRIFLSLIV